MHIVPNFRTSLFVIAGMPKTMAFTKEQEFEVPKLTGKARFSRCECRSWGAQVHWESQVSPM